MKRNLLHKTWFIELVSSVVLAIIFLGAETLITFLRSEPLLSPLYMTGKFLFLSFWFWAFFYWIIGKKSEVEGEYEYHRKKGREAVVRQKGIEEEQKSAPVGPRSFRRKQLGLK